MIISLIKELSSESFINEMKLKYGSIEKLKEAFEKIKRSILHIDLENWKYLINNLNETIKIGERIFTENMTFGEIELEILTIIKKEAPKSISELSKIIHKDMSTIQHKVKKMEQEGLIELKKGNKNSKILLLIMIK